MATGTVNKPTVDAFPSPASGVSFLWDNKLEGLGVKVTTTGARAYVCQYRMAGREASSRRYTIGGHSSP